MSHTPNPGDPAIHALATGIIAGVIITLFGGYQMLFVFAILFAIIAAIAVAPIKSVR